MTAQSYAWVGNHARLGKGCAMPIGDTKINPIRRRFAIGVLFLLSFACAGFLLSSESSATDHVLQLKSTTERYYLGPYVSVLEDRQKNLTIGDVSSPQRSAQFVRHTEKLLNLGLNSYAYWIRFKHNWYCHTLYTQNRWGWLERQRSGTDSPNRTWPAARQAGRFAFCFSGHPTDNPLSAHWKLRSQTNCVANF